VGDAVIWTSGALASLSSGFIVSATSYVALCAVGASLTVLPLALSLRRRHLEIGTPA
jgi:hypothetical protein